VAGRQGMFPPRRHQKRLFNDAHAYNLYSLGGIVKLEQASLARDFLTFFDATF